MRRVLLTVLTACLLILAGCSSGDTGTSGAPASGGPDETPAAVDPVAAGEEVGPNGPWVQDLWVYESVRTLDDTGEEVDLTDEILAGLGTPSRTVDLPEGASFHVYDALAATVTTDSAVRTDVDVVAGVLEFDGSRGLVALGTPAPDAVRPIGLTDSIELDLTFLGERLLPGDPMVVDFVFLQARPAADEEAATGLDLLAARLLSARGHYLAAEDGKGTEPVAFESIMGEAVAGSTRMSVPGKGPISGPMMKGLNSLICTTFPIRCIRKYFKKMSRGVEGAMELLECNLGPCGPQPREPVPAGLCVKGVKCEPPKVRADPHVTSFDGHHLSMQGVGEYLVTRTDGLEVQMRTIPVHPQMRHASGVNMVAMETDETRVVMQVVDRTLTAWVNGSEIDLNPSSGLESKSQHGDVIVTRVGNDVLVVAENGATVHAHHSFNHWIDLGITLPESAQGVIGLLGDADGNPDNDWTARDGSVLAPETSGRALYTGFSDTWRITQEESILRYASGESTATFTDLSFPDQIITLADLDPTLRARAEAVCRMAGVTEEPLLGQCTLDYALSGELGFVRSAQSVVRAQVAAGTTGSGSPSTPGGTPVTTSAAWAAPTGRSGTPAGTTFRHSCPAGGTLHSVWGGDNGVYTNDSSICVAAVHAGLISIANGGSVEVTRTPGLDDYGKGSTRNGVTTRDWEKAWGGSFTLAP